MKINLILIFTASLLFFSCTSTPSAKSQKSIVIYGEPDCNHCQALKTMLDANELVYSFEDVSSDSIQRVVLSIAGKKGIDPVGMRMPFVLVGDDFLMSPPLDSILVRMN